MSEVSAAPAAPAQAHTSMPVPPSSGGAKASAPVTESKPVQASEAPAAAQTKTVEDFFEIPVNGKKMKVSRDELLRDASIYKGGYEKLEEAAKLRKQAESVLDNFKDPEKAMQYLVKSLGVDNVRKTFEGWYEKEVIRPSEMTPEQRRIMELERENGEFKSFKEEQTKREQAEQERHADAEMAKTLQNELIELADSSGLPKDRATIQKMAKWVRINEAKGIKATKELVIKQVWNEIKNDVKVATKELKGDRLIEILGDEVVKEIRAYDLARIRAKRGEQNTPKPESMEQEKPRGFITEAEWKRNLRNWR